MREKIPSTRGIAGLALAASLFLGCQDFLGEDKAGQTANTPAQDVQVAAQGASSQEASDLKATDPVASSQAGAEPAKDSPVTVVDPAKPASEPTSAPAASDVDAECKDIYEQMKTAKDPLYGELKDRSGSLNCNFSKFAVPAVPTEPPDSATVCKMLRSSLPQMDPNSAKYASYQAEIAIYCAGAESPASPVATSPAPEPADPVSACKDVYSQMMGAKEPAYGDLKDKYVSLNCTEALRIGDPFAPPPPPPDSATVCRNLKASLASMEPDNPKYPYYKEDIAIYCPANP